MRIKLRLQEAWRRFWNKSTSEKLTYIFYFLLFLTFAVMYLYPFFNTFMNSFRTLKDYTTMFKRSPFSLPTEWQFDSWGQIFTAFKYKNYTYFDMLWNSLWFLVVNVFCNVAGSVMMAYCIARFRFPGKEFLYGVVIFMQTIPIIGSGAASYKMLNAFGMVNNPYLIWIAWFTGFDFQFIILYGAFKGISPTYSEAAKIDGANNLIVLFRIILPQAWPSIMALVVTSAMGTWNNYSTIMIYLRDYPTIAYGLFVFKQDGAMYAQNANALFSAAVCLSVLPPCILYACSQKLILSNMPAGGLKG